MREEGDGDGTMFDTVTRGLTSTISAKIIAMGDLSAPGIQRITNEGPVVKLCAYNKSCAICGSTASVIC